MARVTVSAPGKLILMGEHAVVYGRPALVAGLDLRLTVHLAPRADRAVHLDLPALGPREETSWEALRSYAHSVRESWHAYSQQPAPESFRTVQRADPAHVVKVALGEASGDDDLRRLPGLSLRVESQLPIGSGFGSSAATAVAVIARAPGLTRRPPQLPPIQPTFPEGQRRPHRR